MLIPEVIYMASQSRCFPYEKSVVLNALYDTIEKLGLSLDSANSARGTLMVANAEHTGRMRIALGFGSSVGQTQVEVYPEDGETSFAEAWGPIIIDELTGSMTRVYPIERGGK
jgi:flagellar biosynthesis/type III secretory pathway chaperone